MPREEALNMFDAPHKGYGTQADYRRLGEILTAFFFCLPGVRGHFAITVVRSCA